jgi:peroxin-6
MIELSTDRVQTDNSLVYTLWSLEPVSQGRALAGWTEIVLLSSGHSIVSPKNGDNSEPDFIEINEGFLGRTEVPAYPFSIRDLDLPEDLLEDHFTLYIRTSDLGKIGILSHDWVGLQS